jgi:hypothetical protein
MNRESNSCCWEFNQNKRGLKMLSKSFYLLLVISISISPSPNKFCLEESEKQFDIKTIYF